MTLTRELLVEKFNKFIRDELSAAAGYTIIANKLKGKDAKNVINELLEHGKEEFEHYTELISYAAQHGFLNELKLELDEDVINYEPLSVEETVKYIQKLESEAREDYKNMVILAKENNAVELEEFFKELMNDEINHYNDLDYVFGDTRPVTERLLVEKLLR